MTISAKVITDSVSPEGIRLTTLQLRYPRFIHSEFMTHRQFSRNASSSRAVPVKKLIEDVINDPIYPSYWGANQKGMQATTECNTSVIVEHRSDITFEAIEYSKSREQAWDMARNNAIQMAQAFDDAGYHKQIVNRLLEPFSHINVVVTATEYSNFFALRDHTDAQPEIRILAQEMKKAMDVSTPKPIPHDGWHLPYATEDDWIEINGGGVATPDQIEAMIKISVARCARVSYLTHDRRASTIDEDIALYNRLLGKQPIHASPSEHQAQPDVWLPNYNMGEGCWESPELHGNFKGWKQFRKTLPGECQ